MLGHSIRLGPELAVESTRRAIWHCSAYAGWLPLLGKVVHAQTADHGRCLDTDKAVGVRLSGTQHILPKTPPSTWM